MYVVLMAMLALNVSNEVLNGFSLVDDGLNRSTANSVKGNSTIYDDFAAQMKANPQKVKEWFDKAQTVKSMSDSLYNLAQDLKIAIVKEADGKDGDLKNIKAKDDLEAASHVMLAPGTGKGELLYKAINDYRKRILTMLPAGDERKIIADNLATEVSRQGKALGKNWQESMFENMPVAAAVTLLSKLQNDVRHAEGEVLHNLIANVDVKDIRVNKLSAFVIPESRTVVAGDKFSAQIVMAAVDTTLQPQIYIGNQKVNLRNSTYEFTASGVGEHSFSGYITMQNGGGDIIRRDFTQKYTVVNPSATVSADLMNVLYAGYENPISISIPGVPLNAVTATMSGGEFRNIGMGRYIAKPSAVGKDVTITVSATTNGSSRQMGTFTFKVRKLPDPIAYIPKGDDRFYGGNMTKAQLMDATGIKAAIDDGLLDIQFKVVSFETTFFDRMGNAVPMASDGANFSARQKEQFRKLTSGRRFYIGGITAIGPDGISRKLSAVMEVKMK